MARGIISVSHKGDFNGTESFLKSMKQRKNYSKLDRLAKQGAAALASATPVDSGTTAASWGYKIDILSQTIKITWTNSNIVDGYPIAILIQYGHGTGNGGYVEGRDYINPAIRPIFDKILEQVWKGVEES